jgi:iron(III) transport system permease protein
MSSTKLKLKKNLNTLKTYFSRPQNTITIIFLMILLATVVFPLFGLLKESLLIHAGGEAARYGLKPGTVTPIHWNNTLFHSSSLNNFYKPLYRSCLMALLACFIAIFVGGGLAFLITRTNIPCKKFLSVFFLFPYIMPSWSIAMFWESFFKNSSVDSAYNQIGFLELITTIRVPEWMVYGFFPMAMVLGIHYAPFAYILIGGILKNMDANLEEAGTILKASRFKVFRRITLPIIKPGIVSTFLLVFSSSMSSYTVPVYLNKNNKFSTISIMMRQALQDSDNRGIGYVIGIILILITMIILGLNSLLSSSRKSYVTVTGKSGQISKINLRKAKWPILILAMFVTVFFSIVPLITFGFQSFLTVNADGKAIFTNYYWLTDEQITTRAAADSRGILRNALIWKSIGRSILLSFVVALIVGMVGILLGYAISRKRRSFAAKSLSALSFIPYLIPALSFGATYYALTYNEGFRWLNGTFLLVVLVASVKFLPFASRSGTNAMMQLSTEIEEAGIMLGVPWRKRMSKILFPIQKSSFLSGYLLPFISTMREYTLFALIAPVGSLLTLLIRDFDTSGVSQIANGLNFIMMIVIIVLNFLINKITGASIDKGIGGN